MVPVAVVETVSDAWLRGPDGVGCGLDRAGVEVETGNAAELEPPQPTIEVAARAAAPSRMRRRLICAGIQGEGIRLEGPRRSDRSLYEQHAESEVALAAKCPENPPKMRR